MATRPSSRPRSLAATGAEPRAAVVHRAHAARWARVLLLLLVCFALAACTDGGDDDSTTGDATATVDVATGADVDASSTTDASGQPDATTALDASDGDDDDIDAADTTSDTRIADGTADLADGTDASDATDTDATDTTDAAVDADMPPVDTRLDDLLAGLRADVDAAMRAQANAGDGWPAPVAGGHLFVSTDPTLATVAGDHDGWAGTAMTVESGFAWVVLEVDAGNRYKFTDLADRWVADPWSRAYEYDDFGEMSMLAPATAHRERYFGIGDSEMVPRRVRVWVPDASQTVDRVLYVADGQNLFDPNAVWGGWRLHESAPDGVLIVGIDNTVERMSEYTHVTDDPFGDGALGGRGDLYASFWQNTVRPLVDDRYGEPALVGVMGSSLGGLVSLHIADRYPAEVDFVASLSGTVGWGSIGITNETIIERYDAAGKRSFPIYIDSGGGGTCVDSDGDGIEDDAPDGADNYCVNKQLEATLLADGYVAGTDLWHWWEADAPHNEAAWAARVFRPLDLFAGL